MSSIVLKQGQVTAVIEQEGAFLTSIHTGSQTVIFPRKQIQSSYGVWKTRGGCHICFPNFGPGGETGLLQHGFGRTENWDQLTTSDSQVYFRLSGGSETYSQIRADLRYTLLDDGLRCELLVKNLASDPIDIAPAFHPYFALPKGIDHVTVDDVDMALSDLSGTVFIENPKKITVGAMDLSFKQINLPLMAVWTDQLDDYVCFEPTYSGNSFEEDPSLNLHLQGQEAQRFMMEFHWSFQTPEA